MKQTRDKMRKGVAFGIIAVLVSAMLLASIPTVSASEELYGDANGDGEIDMRDLTYVKLIIFGKKPANELADANRDGMINVGDITYIEYLIIIGEAPLPDGTLGTLTVTVNAPEMVKAGGTFDVTIDVDNVVDFNSAQFDLSFDSGVVKVTGIADGSLDSETIPLSMWDLVDANTIRVLLDLPGVAGVSGSGCLATICFEVVEEGGDKSVLAISNVLLVNTEAEEIPAVWIDDEVIVVRPEQVNLTAKQPRNVVAEDDDYTIEGTATGVDDVDIVLIGPEGYYPIYDPLLNVLNGLAITSTPVTDNEFSEDITMTEGVDIGRWKIMVFSPGLDGEYGDLYLGAGELYRIPTAWFAGKTQEQIVAILLDRTVDVAGSDDLYKMLEFKVESPYIRLDPIAPVAVGEPLYISGTTNREPGTTVVIWTIAGPVELYPVSVRVEWPTPDEGVFSATIDTTDAIPGRYLIEADDGDGNTDTSDVEIVEKIVPPPAVYPPIIPTDTPTSVTIITAFIDPNYVPIPESVKLWKDSTILGTFRDDGTGGDPVAGDLIYTIIPVFSESTETTIPLRVSAQFIGVSEEIFSRPFSIKVSEEAIICAGSETVTLGEEGSFTLPDLTGAAPDVPGAVLLNQGIFPRGAEVTQDPPPGTVFTEPGSVDITFTAVDAETMAQCTMTLSIVDAIPPEVIVEGIKSGDVFVNCVTPIIRVSDNLDPSEAIELQALLNSEDYTPGTPICEPGEYTLSVIATDDSGNSAESPQIVFAIVDTSKTKGAVMVVSDLNCTETEEGVSMGVTVLLASNQFDIFEIDGYSVMLHAFGEEGEVIDEQPIRVAGTIGPDGFYSPLTANASFQRGFWELKFEAELLDYPTTFLITGSAVEGEIDWVAGALLEQPDPIPEVVTLAPLNVPLAPAVEVPDPEGNFTYANVSDQEDTGKQDGFKEAPKCPKCKWKYTNIITGKKRINPKSRNSCKLLGVTQTWMDLWVEGGYINGEATAIDNCVGFLADDAASAISERTIKVWLEGAPAECCSCKITLVAMPSFKAEVDLNPPGIAQAGGKIAVRGDLNATAAGSVVSGTSTQSVSFTAGAVSATVPAISVTKGKKSQIFAGSDAKSLNKCSTIVTVQGTGFLKTKADADVFNWYARADANLKESKLNIMIKTKCTALKPKCAPPPLIIKLR